LRLFRLQGETAGEQAEVRGRGPVFRPEGIYFNVSAIRAHPVFHKRSYIGQRRIAYIEQIKLRHVFAAFEDDALGGQ
jgi:hypothetical protein